MTNSVGVVDRLDADPEVRLTGHLFGRAFEGVPQGAWRAPGGLTLLGGGSGAALTVALPWGVIVVAGPRADGVAEIYSMNHHTEQFAMRPGELTEVPAWAEPCVRALDSVPGPRPGIQLVVNRELPAEMGLLTGAETFCTVSLALRDLHGLEVPETDPDPAYAASLHGRTRKALLVRTGAGVDHVSLDLVAAGLRLLVMDVGVEDTTPDAGAAGDAEAAVAALRAGKAAVLGPLLTEGHSRGVEVLDLALDTARDAGGLGGRAIGKCAVALVPMTAVPRVRATVTARLAGIARRPPRFLTAVPVGGARRVS